MCDSIRLINIAFPRKSFSKLNDEQDFIKEIDGNVSLKNHSFVQSNIAFCSKLNQNYDISLLEKKEAFRLLQAVQRIYLGEIEYLNAKKLDYSEKLSLSKKTIEEGLSLINDICKFQYSQINFKENKKNSSISFGNTKQLITKQQRESCNVAINTSAAICAGISAFFGEANLVKADIPFLLTTETAMFARLANVLNVKPGAAIMHGIKHAGQAQIAGMGILKTAYNIAGIGAHAVSGTTTGGIGNIGVTFAVRTGNAGLSALMCESMGRAFLKDYENGRMTTEQKTLDFLAFVTFMSLTKGFDDIIDLEKPAVLAEEKFAKAIGKNIAIQMPKGVGEFINTTINLKKNNYLSFGAKGLELIIPAISSYAIEHKGRIKDEDIEEIIKGSVLSLACNEYFGNSHYFETLGNEPAKAQLTKIMFKLKNEPTIENMVKNEIKSAAFDAFGHIDFNNKNLAKNLEEMYDKVIPVVEDFMKNMELIP